MVCTGLAQIRYGWRYSGPQNVPFWVLKMAHQIQRYRLHTRWHTGSAFQIARLIVVPDPAHQIRYIR